MTVKVAPEPHPESDKQPATRSRRLAEERTVQDDIDEQLLPIFLEEAGELYPQIGANLHGWREQPGEERLGNRLQRLLHTLKGSARMAGVMRLGELTHRMEGRVVAAMSQARRESALWEELDGYFERIGNMLEQLRGGAAAEQHAEAETAALDAERAIFASMLRVRCDIIDHLISEAGQISEAHARAEAGLRALRDGLLELTRGMNESLKQGLLKNLDATAAALSAQAHLNRDLQHGLMAIRMVPFSSISKRLHRIVRQTAKELDKKVNLELVGTEVELERSVLERMVAPLEHLLRNAIAHGLESPEQRAGLGKPPIGEIRLALSRESNEAVFEFSDDGAGLDLDSLRRRAVEHGVLRAGEAITDEQAMQLIFSNGISTAAEVTEISGRGIGMDVVRSEIRALGGHIDVGSERGKGTRFKIRLPLVPAVHRG